MNNKQWHNDTLGPRVVEALKRNNFDAIYFSESAKANKYVLDFVAAGLAIGIGGSTTLKELKIAEKVKEKGAVVLDHNADGLTPEQKLETRRKQLLSDVFICSTNAITMDGILVNCDGVGNRVAAMIFGPRKVIVVAGMNKLCLDIHAAYERIKHDAAPMNNKRLNLPNPCVTTGTCMDCKTNTRICNIYSVMQKKPANTDITIVLIGESLGF